jgi:hypothetical protein
VRRREDGGEGKRRKDDLTITGMGPRIFNVTSPATTRVSLLGVARNYKQIFLDVSPYLSTMSLSHPSFYFIYLIFFDFSRCC